MKIIADLHIHSKYARACSKDLNPENLYVWARKKGIGIIGTGDFTHPGWLGELKENLIEDKPGLYCLSKTPTPAPLPEGEGGMHFMLTAEVSSIYKQGDKVRRVHNLLFAPSLEAVEKLNHTLEARGINLKADGRPIMGLKCPELVKICKSVDERIEIVPAHAWTPHFGVFGSLSGFDSLEEAFEDQSKYIFAVETGLSSDPKMNWQVSSLDNISLISNSDAHSLRKLGREANVFEIDETKLSYDEVIRIMKQKNPKEFLETLEFFPEEGKYHLDGHRECKFSCVPEETKRLGGACPVCGKKLLRGVLYRVSELGDREFGFEPKHSVSFRSVIPLEEIIAETLDVGPASKKVLEMYERMVGKQSEFSMLLDASQADISSIGTPEIAESILRVRQGNVHVEGGYDGIFGTIHIYGDEERKSAAAKQTLLF